MKQIRVLHLIDSLNIGGAEVLAVNINNILNQEKQVKSFICSTRLEGELKNRILDKKNYLFLNKKSLIDFSAIIRLNKYLKVNRINIIHAHSSSYFLAVLVKLINFKTKIVWHDHFGMSDQLENRTKQPINLFSNFFSCALFVNEKLFNWAEKNLNVKKIFLLNNFPNLNNKKKKTFLNGEEGKRVVCVAAFRPQKDHLNLLKAFKIVLNQHPTWTLHLIGKENESEYFKKIEQFIIDHNLSENIFFYGACNDLAFILSQSTIGVLSSLSEGLPISLLEYGVSGLPVVVTNVGDCNKVVFAKTGILVEKQNAKKLAEGLSTYISSKEKRIKFGENLKSLVNKDYSASQFKNKLVNIYQNSI